MRARQPDKSAFIERDGVKVHYEVYGDGPETLLFLPAWAICYSRLWKMQLPYFSRFYRCIAFDPRGNGQSDRPTDFTAHGINHFIADALAVLDAENVDKTIVIGLSMGGLYAGIMAAYHSSRVLAAVAIAGTFQIGAEYDFGKDFNSRFEEPQGWQKFNRYYWQANYQDFIEFFYQTIINEPHSTKAIEDAVGWAQETTPEVLVANARGRRELSSHYDAGADMLAQIKVPLLLLHGDADQIVPVEKSQLAAELTDAELLVLPNTGHVPNTRFTAQINVLIKDFLDRHVPSKPTKSNKPCQTRPKKAHHKKALYLSSPIGLGHARRDLAIARELRQLHPDLHIDWLAQDPVTRLLAAHQESIHPASRVLVNESQHLESEAGEHELHAFQALRRMDEILIANFMLFQEVLEEDHYDLVIADEAWDVDYYWHEHPEFKRAPMVWLTDFVGFVPMPQGGEHEAYLTTD